MLNKRYYIEKEKYEKLIARKNVKSDFYNGIFDRYEYPVLTRHHIPVEWKYDLNDNHIYFKSYKENNIRKVEIKYDFEIDNSDSEYVRYDKYDENTTL